MKEETQPKRPESARACWPRDHRRAAGDNAPPSSRPGPFMLPFQPSLPSVAWAQVTKEIRSLQRQRHKMQCTEFGHEGQWTKCPRFHLKGQKPTTPYPVVTGRDNHP